MSVTELIDQLKALSAMEREAFARLFHELERPTVPVAGNDMELAHSGKREPRAVGICAKLHDAQQGASQWPR